MNTKRNSLKLRVHCARKILLAAQNSRFRGVGGYSPEAFAAKQVSLPYPQAARESSLYRDFFQFFRDDLNPDQHIRNSIVLDFGSGYGGRTVDYARIGGSRFVWGVEPVETHTLLARQYAESLNIRNVEFRTCGERTIPLPDASIDVVLSYDVLEHVVSPPDTIVELYRVLRPGGLAFLVFPVYLGMRSHHLDYMTTLPGLHWLFSADTLICAVNSILSDDSEMKRFGTREQPPAQLSFDANHLVLPMLNGLGSAHLGKLFEDFSVLDISRHVVGRSKPRLRAFTELISHKCFPFWVRDAVTDSISCVLQKPMR